MPVITPTGGGGGGGFVPSRNVGQAAFTFNQQVVRGSAVQLTLAFDSGDAGMVDLTDPTSPKVIQAGVYAFTLDSGQSVEGDQPYGVGLRIDDNFYALHATVESLAPIGWSKRSASATWWCDASDPFAVVAQVDNTGNIDPTFGGAVYVQRIR